MRRAPPAIDAPKALLRGLARVPSPAARVRLRALLRALLAWHRTLTRFPASRPPAPDATAFVSVYEGGLLRGCFGTDDGAPAERVVRAFLLAMNDARFGGLGHGSSEDGRVRGSATAVLSYAHSIARVGTSNAPHVVEAGTHGLFYVRDDGQAAILLPQVARDGRLGPRGLLAALAQKAGVSELAEDRVFVFETHDVSTSATPRRARAALASGAAFLESLVRSDGHVDFMIDARTGARRRTGEMHHGRAAIVVSALEASGRRAVAARARRRLARDLEGALGGRAPEGWPTDPFMAGGTVALAVRAGVEATSELAELARRQSFAESPWHGAQIVAALGARSPRGLYEGCLASLDAHPWAPWTAMAARAMGDERVVKRCAGQLARSVRSRGPHVGGVGFDEVPELALTALVVEALVPPFDSASRAAVARARSFLLKWQNEPSTPRGPIDAGSAAGGFPLSPVSDALRGDVTGHALLAIVGSFSPSSRP